MNEPIISYSAKLSKYQNYRDVDELFAGTYTSYNPIEIDLRIWNNRFGTSDVEDLENFVINLFFDKYEDNSLLNFVKINYNDIEEVPITVSNGVATATFLNNVVISGKSNSGSDVNTDNYINLKILFDVDDPEVNLKDNDFKSLYVEVVKQ